MYWFSRRSSQKGLQDLSPVTHISITSPPDSRAATEREQFPGLGTRTPIPDMSSASTSVRNRWSTSVDRGGATPREYLITSPAISLSAIWRHDSSLSLIPWSAGLDNVQRTPLNCDRRIYLQETLRFDIAEFCIIRTYSLHTMSNLKQPVMNIFIR